MPPWEAAVLILDGNTASGTTSTVGGGFGNTASGPNATVAGGGINTASAQGTTVSGQNNTASGDFATVPGGNLNTAQGDYSFAAGRRAKAINQGAFVWGDSTNADISSTAGDQVTFRASNGFRILNGPDNNGSIATLQVTNSSGQTLLLDGNEIDSDDSLHLNFNSSTNISLAAGGGVVSIGTSSPTAEKLRVAGDIRLGTGTTGCLMDNDATVLVGSCVSDVRLKTGVRPFQPVLGRLVQLQPVRFYWRADDYPEFHFGRQRSFGLIAQEVEKVLPELVVQNDRGFKAVRYQELPLLLLQALRELKAENDALKQALAERVGSLEAEVMALKAVHTQHDDNQLAALKSQE